MGQTGSCEFDVNAVRESLRDPALWGWTGSDPSTPIHRPDALKPPRPTRVAVQGGVCEYENGPDRKNELGSSSLVPGRSIWSIFFAWLSSIIVSTVACPALCSCQ